MEYLSDLSALKTITYARWKNKNWQSHFLENSSGGSK